MNRRHFAVLLSFSALAVSSAPLFAATDFAEGDFTIGPNYKDAPEFKVGEKTPRGRVEKFTMDSADSKLYPGLKGPYKRDVWVYIPAKYKAGTPSPVIIVMDGGSYQGRLAPVLDTLIAEKRVPSQIAVLINSGGGDGKGSQRGLEYDTVSDVYSQFVETEVLPKVAKDYDVTFTKDPEGRATMGGSSGAACAFTMAWFRPDLYRRVLSYSGTFVAQESPTNPKTPHGAWEYHENLIPKSPAKPIRLWMQVGEMDNGYKNPDTSFHNWVRANNLMAKALKAKGYHYRYEFSKNAGHVDGKVVKQTLPAALEWMWKGYVAK